MAVQRSGVAVPAERQGAPTQVFPGLGPGKAAAAAQLSLHPGQHFPVVKGLGHKIVRSQGQGIHPVVHRHFGGQHDDGHGLTLPDLSDELFPG